MKIKAALFALFVLGLSSCAYKTCPTYAKAPAQQTAGQVAR
jgi:hypothetical protein